MSFGIPVRNGLAIGLGSVATLATDYAGVVPPSGFSVLDAAGVSYSVPLTVLGADGASYTVSSTVLGADGTSYTPI